MKVILIKPCEMSAGEILLLIKGARDCAWVHEDLATRLVKQALVGEAFIYRVSEGVEGLMICSLNKDELFVELFAGKGFIKHFFEVREQLKTLAAALGRKKLAGWVTRDGLAKLYETKTNAKRVASLYVEDV